MCQEEISGADDEYKFDIEHCVGLVLDKMANQMTGMESIEPDMDKVFDSTFDPQGILLK